MTCDSPEHRHCLALFEKLSEYIDQELAPEARRDIETHVAECLACFACLQTLKQTIALCRQAGDQPVPDGVFPQTSCRASNRDQTAPALNAPPGRHPAPVDNTVARP